MSDHDLRAAESAWRADPSDQRSLERAILERKRSGVSVPGEMWNARVRSGRTITSQLALEVWVELPTGERRLVGRTPGAVSVPDHRWLWVVARGGPPQFARLVEELRENAIHGVELSPHYSWRAEDLRRAATLEGLEWFSMQGWELDQIDEIVAMQNLAVLELNRGCEVAHSAQSLGWLCLLPHLHRLRAGINGSGLAALSVLPNLTELELATSFLDEDPDLTGLGDLQNLRRLHLCGARGVSEHALLEVARLRELRDLDLRCIQAVDDRRLDALSELSQLRRLSVRECCDPTPTGLAALERLGLLEELDVSWTSLDGAALARIVAGARRLRHLTMNGCVRVTDMGCLGALELLETVAAKWCALAASTGFRIRSAVRFERTDARVRLEALGGMAPVQGSGEVGHRSFYFRARGNHWSFCVEEADRCIFERGADYGTDPYDASYMPLDEASEFLRVCLEEYLQELDASEVNASEELSR